MPVRRLLAAVVAAALLALLPVPAALAATEATSSADAERILVDLVNQRRAEAGVPALTPRADLHAVARDWSFVQAERDRLAHNSNLGSQVCCWTRIAENVATRGGLDGAGASRLAQELYALWRASGPHDQAMIDPDVDQVGLGVVLDGDGSVWGTTVFRACDGTSCSGGAQGPAGNRTVSWAPPPPPPAPDPEPAPKPAPAPEPEPEPEPEPAPSPSPTPQPSPSPTPSPRPTPSPSPSPSPTPEPAPTVTPLVAANLTGEPSSGGIDLGGIVVAIGSVVAIGTAVAARRRRED